MAFSVSDYEDLIRLLREHPEWRAELRREILADEFLQLPALVRENSEDIRALREVVAQNSRDIVQNSRDIQELKEVVAQNSRDIQELKEVVAQNSRDIQELVALHRAHEIRLTRMDGRLGSAEGTLAEWRWSRHFDGRFGRLVRRARLLTTRDLDLFNRAEDSGTISDEAADAVRDLDLIVQGVEGRGPDAREVVLAVEISVTIERSDVERARARAATLAAVGYTAIPVVAGARMDATLKSQAETSGIRVLLRPEDITEVPAAV